MLKAQVRGHYFGFVYQKSGVMGLEYLNGSICRKSFGIRSAWQSGMMRVLESAKWIIFTAFGDGIKYTLTS